MSGAPESRRDGAPTEAVNLVLLLGVACTWGVHWPIMKLALCEIGPWTFRAACIVLGGGLLFALARASGQRLGVPRREIAPLIGVAILNTDGFLMLSAYGVSLMPASRAVILGYTIPLWAAILGAIFLKERLTPARLAGLALGLAGLGSLIGPEIAAAFEVPVGALFVLGSAASLAGGAVLTKACRWTIPTLTLVSWQTTIGGIAIVAVGLVAEPVAESIRMASTTVWLAVLYNVVASTAFAVWAWFHLLKRLPVQVASIGIMLAPVIGVFSSTWITEDVIGWREIVALALVVSSFAVISVSPSGLRTLPRA